MTTRDPPLLHAGCTTRTPALNDSGEDTGSWTQGTPMAPDEGRCEARGLDGDSSACAVNPTFALHGR